MIRSFWYRTLGDDTLLLVVVVVVEPYIFVRYGTLIILDAKASLSTTEEPGTCILHVEMWCDAEFISFSLLHSVLRPTYSRG